MEGGEIDSIVSDIGLREEAERIVTSLESAVALADIPFVGIHDVAPKTGDVDAALEGVYRLRDQRFPLSPPIDWWDEPYRFPGERGFFQNSFVFADPLLSNPRFPEVLVPLAEIFTDWLSSNPREGSAHPHRYAWHDHAAAGRIVTMAFVLREGVRRELLDRAASRALAAGVIEHARYLLADANYAAQNNHGFASDAALVLAARSLEPAPQVEPWARVAERRFAAVLDHMIDTEDAVHLEHSPHYHWVIHGALSRLTAAGLFEGLDLDDLTTRMEMAGAWLVAPDGTLPPIGDTPAGHRPPASVAADPPAGMRVFGAAGYAVVRAGDSALIVTAAHHPTAHKHADDGSFCLYEQGRPIVLDSGSPGYEYDSAEFRYGTSPAAHATICIDGFDWAKEAAPYGSGMVASTERNGTYALLTRNPATAPGGGSARRILVYRPGRFLLVLDDTETEPSQQLVRSLPLAADLDAALGQRGEVLISRAGGPVAWLVQLLTAGAPLDQVELLHGFNFPSPDEPQASCDVALVGRGGEPKGYALLLDDSAPGIPVMTWNAAGGSVAVKISGLTRSTLELRVDGESLALGPS